MESLPCIHVVQHVARRADHIAHTPINRFEITIRNDACDFEKSVPPLNVQPRHPTQNSKRSARYSFQVFRREGLLTRSRSTPTAPATHPACRAPEAAGSATRFPRRRSTSSLVRFRRSRWWLRGSGRLSTRCAARHCWALDRWCGCQIAKAAGGERCEGGAWQAEEECGRTGVPLLDRALRSKGVWAEFCQWVALLKCLVRACSCSFVVADRPASETEE